MTLEVAEEATDRVEEESNPVNVSPPRMRHESSRAVVAMTSARGHPAPRADGGTIQ